MIDAIEKQLSNPGIGKNGIKKTLYDLIFKTMKESIKKTKSDKSGQMKTGITVSNNIAFENSGHSLFLEETHTNNQTLIKFAGQ